MKDRKSEWKWTEKYDVFNLKRQTEGKGIVNFFLKREAGETFFFLLPARVVSSFGERKRWLWFSRKKRGIRHDRVESTREKSINSKTHLLLAFYPLQPTLEWMSEEEKQFHPWLHLLRFVSFFLLLPNDFLMQQQLTLIARQVPSCFPWSSPGIKMVRMAVVIHPKSLEIFICWFWSFVQRETHWHLSWPVLLSLIQR